MVDASHEKEARAKETISQLKSEISNLSRLVEQGAGLSMGQVLSHTPGPHAPTHTHAPFPRTPSPPRAATRDAAPLTCTTS